jgi:hypothetical protein
MTNHHTVASHEYLYLKSIEQTFLPTVLHSYIEQRHDGKAFIDVTFDSQADPSMIQIDYDMLTDEFGLVEVDAPLPPNTVRLMKQP